MKNSPDLEMIQQAYIRAQTCDICTTGRQSHQSNLVYPLSIIQSADQKHCAGCLVLCGILVAYGSILNDGLVPEWRVSSNEPFEVKNHGATISFRNDFSLNVFTLPKNKSPWNFPSLPEGSSTLVRQGTESTVSRTQSWLQDCTYGAHKHCKAAKSAMPTRVIEILGNESVRLRDSDGQVSHYLCLSHCWGQNDFIRTTTQTVHRFKQGVPWDSLPRTFQHAIQFTYNLGYKYLWIDSLCIIQDNDDDWRMEGSRMSDIYSNALLTIAATASASASHGCFKTGSASSSALYTHPDADGKLQSVCVREKIDHSGWIFGHMPLLKRGWVLQERLLSPRVAHFTGAEVVWECRTITDCECAEIDSEHHVNGISDFTKALSADDQDLGKLWHTIVEEYARRCLSFERDIFPALQGIAKQFQIRSRSEYLAGLWENDVIRDLLWYSKASQKPQQWRAPSWSWASVVGPIQWITSEYNIEEVATYAGSCVITIGNDGFGEISSGELVLKGKFICHGVIEWQTLQECTLELDPPLSKSAFWADIFDPNKGTIRAVVVLPVAKIRFRDLTLLYNLVLSVKHDAPRLYERVGLLYLRRDRDDLDDLRIGEEELIRIV